MKNISEILRNTYLELLSKKAVYFLGLIALVATILFGMQYYALFTQPDPGDPGAVISQRAGILAQSLGFWAGMSILLGIIYSAGSIHYEKREKTIQGILAKPIARWEFLLGKYLGLLYFFGAFYVTGVILCFGFMWYWEIGVTLLFLTGLVQLLAGMAVYMAISFILSIFSHPVGGGGLAFVLWSFSSEFKALMETSYGWSRAIGSTLYYLSPVAYDSSVISNGLLDNAIDPAYGAYWAAIGENIFYAAIVLYLGALAYKRKDIIVS